MMKLLSSSKLLTLASRLVAKQAAQVRERRSPFFVSGHGPRAAFVPRRVGHSENQLVLYQVAQCHFLPRQYSIRRLRIGRIGVDLGLSRGANQQLFLVQFQSHLLAAPLAAQPLPPPPAYAHARTAAP